MVDVMTTRIRIFTFLLACVCSVEAGTRSRPPDLARRSLIPQTSWEAKKEFRPSFTPISKVLMD